MMTNQEFDLKTVEFQRQIIKDELGQCTQEQQQFFCRIFGKVDAIKQDKLNTANSLIHRTLVKNGREMK